MPVRDAIGYAYELETDHGPEHDRKLYTFKGPGLPRYSAHAVVWREYDAETIARLLAHAFEAGREAKAAEIRAALGVR